MQSRLNACGEGESGTISEGSENRRKNKSTSLESPRNYLSNDTLKKTQIHIINSFYVLPVPLPPITLTCTCDVELVDLYPCAAHFFPPECAYLEHVESRDDMTA